jgi:hypothetical protein
VWSTLLQLDIGHWFIGLFVYWFIYPPMPFDSEKRSKVAQRRQRDAHGHFAPLKPKVKVSGQSNLLSKLIDTDGNPDADSMMGVYFRNPFKKMIEILDDIRKKQSTRVNLSLTIPLIALPVVLVLAFQFGRYQTECQTHFSTQTGTLQNITVVRKVAPDHWFLKALTYIPFIGDAYIEEKTLKEAVLTNPQNETIIINNEAGADLNPFNQGKVIVFGDYNSCSRTLNLESDKNISNL